ncbi:MAG: hypothetical protein COY22_01010 [Candidatus Tagabacteria bacterium CG_4_10_14_0_2_um_filter_40_13]|uniref:DUF4446 domain-containing protein n=2 Tax=Candidatus Tagaibacteriota TaxID=1817918 RepID=A0A2M7B974_9BACT|nr:MAG: hypothetical protein COV90_00155 [Candidatus Tagabacteria bacterium CG11_big_fil_rev_8_21_14_0_20_41_11]PIU99674.1 MAG: hypothetical protein COS58_01075 [Candidatus Tagabacteria bacterium CG03_land_8_20_14_0_80_41_22]PIZ56474.1 MAG: hypothetical protein COY22_01010 [Candidatus Tagabacteria bacterium CG_4_10_14_0_2_um_filter_40_13]PJC25165.1 MAG: hypothetical protein CO056_01785 [Candidatus Tagabacteria bacterium CG_4_9_14_0_2_um_filter_41_11]
MNTNIILYVSIGCVVLLAVWLGLIELRLKKIFRGKKAGDLEEVMRSLGEDLKNLNISREKTENYLKEVEKRLKKSLKQVGIVRFNPFGAGSGQGSNQSFSIALLDEIGNGAVISALYMRDNIKIYAKPVTEYKSEYSLSEEENEAIRKNKTSQ